ncbi:MAG: hypothetical protein BGO78_03660 [Chloroflexi bacterium 44-23]|nr:MAG: hypothetical protein BGO78_03660 [Chloroflexi bacterium 44-23]
MQNLKFADFAISIANGSSDFNVEIPTVYQQFFTKEAANIFLSVDWTDLSEFALPEPVFYSGGIWSLHKVADKWVIPVCFPLGSEPVKVGRFDEDFRRGELLINTHKQNLAPIFPLGYPLDEVLIINLLAKNGGIELHACAMKIEGLNIGLIFAGVSGAGKSTITRLWMNQPGVTILSDDRIIVRKKDDGYMIYGTPWHGDALGASSQSAKIDRIYILKQAPVNQISELKAIEAASKLFIRSFPTFWDRSGMQNSLKFLDELTSSVPCYQFEFLPDQSAIDFILQELSK